MEKTYRAINWNVLDDALDKAVWEKLTEQFWLDTRIPLSNDLSDWKKMKEEEILKVFATGKDTYRIKEEVTLSGTKEHIGTLLWTDVPARER